MSESNISIERMIVHQVNHRKEKRAGFVLSELDLPVEEYPEVVELLTRHIDSSLNHAYIRNATFKSGPMGALQSNCDRLLGNTDRQQFIDLSQDIARHLFSIVDGRPQISPGDLVVCTFKEGNEEEPEQLGLLKMDSQESFIDELQVIDGKKQISLKKIEGVLPTGVLQKGAFILPPPLRKKKDYDIRVLDFQQKRIGVNSPVASFFGDEFLQSEIKLTSADMTNLFVNLSYKYADKKKGVWTDEFIDNFKNNVLDELDKDEIDIPEFARENFPDKPEEQEEYIAYLRKKLPLLIFKPDSGLKDQMTQKTIFVGDNGLKVEINTNSIGPGSTLEYEEDGEFVRVTITTRRWEKKVVVKKEKGKEKDNLQEEEESQHAGTRE